MSIPMVSVPKCRPFQGSTCYLCFCFKQGISPKSGEALALATITVQIPEDDDKTLPAVGKMILNSSLNLPG
jgi:hypothetical protein